MAITLNNIRGSLPGRKGARRQGGQLVGLEHGELFRLEGDRRGLVVQALEGRVWLTQSGGEQDVILERQQAFRIDRKGLVLLQGLPQGRIRLVEK